MMKNENCRCGHHGVMRVVVALAWVAGVLFFWSIFAQQAVYGFGPGELAWTVVVLVLLAKTSVGCKCCCGEKHCQTCQVKPM